MKISILDKEYIVEKNVNDALDVEAISLKYTDYFDDFDYIVGDWAYGKLRLKGFNDKENENFKEINDIATVSKYIEEYCAYGCKYFILKRLNYSSVKELENKWDFAHFFLYYKNVVVKYWN